MSKRELGSSMKPEEWEKRESNKHRNQVILTSTHYSKMEKLKSACQALHDLRGDDQHTHRRWTNEVETYFRPFRVSLVHCSKDPIEVVECLGNEDMVCAWMFISKLSKDRAPYWTRCEEVLRILMMSPKWMQCFQDLGLKVEDLPPGVQGDFAEELQNVGGEARPVVEFAFICKNERRLEKQRSYLEEAAKESLVKSVEKEGASVVICFTPWDRLSVCETAPTSHLVTPTFHNPASPSAPSSPCRRRERRTKTIPLTLGDTRAMSSTSTPVSTTEGSQALRPMPAVPTNNFYASSKTFNANEGAVEGIRNPCLHEFLMSPADNEGEDEVRQSGQEDDELRERRPRHGSAAFSFHGKSELLGKGEHRPGERQRKCKEVVKHAFRRSLHPTSRRFFSSLSDAKVRSLSETPPCVSGEHGNEHKQEEGEEEESSSWRLYLLFGLRRSQEKQRDVMDADGRSADGCAAASQEDGPDTAHAKSLLQTDQRQALESSLHRNVSVGEKENEENTIGVVSMMLQQRPKHGCARCISTCIPLSGDYEALNLAHFWPQFQEAKKLKLGDIQLIDGRCIADDPFDAPLVAFATLILHFGGAVEKEEVTKCGSQGSISVITHRSGCISMIRLTPGIDGLDAPKTLAPSLTITGDKGQAAFEHQRLLFQSTNSASIEKSQCGDLRDACVEAWKTMGNRLAKAGENDHFSPDLVALLTSIRSKLV